MEKTIFIVDDEPAIAATLEYVLRSEGFQTQCAGLGQQALEALRTTEFSLVILDVDIRACG